ncbi:MAG TPA: DMT family transporter [Candidatus Dormibacteraeota bacterium]|nr:DMT family transporter [Candidatus Dormibacteraeota bacterium]
MDCWTWPYRTTARIVSLNPLLSPAAALGSAATLGVADFTGGLAGRRTPPPAVALGVESVGFVVAPLALWLLPVRFDVAAALFTFAGGAVGGFGLILFYRAMALNMIGVVAPITAVVAAALPVGFGVLVFGERLHLGQVAGIVVGLGAIALINGGGSGSTRDARLAVGLAIAAGVCFGAFFVLYHAGSGGGVVAFLSGRVASGMIAIAFALVSRVSPIPEVKAWRLILIAGTLDGAGVVLYLYATFHGLLSLTALLTSFYPAFTILAARFVLRERLAPRQAAGALLAIVAVALIAAA